MYCLKKIFLSSKAQLDFVWSQRIKLNLTRAVPDYIYSISICRLSVCFHPTNAFHLKWHIPFVPPGPLSAFKARMRRRILFTVTVLFRQTLSMNNKTACNFQNGRCSHLPLLLCGSSDLVSVVRHDWAQSPACHSAILFHTREPVSHSYKSVAERWASLLYIAAPAARPYWRKLGADDCLHNRIVAMVTYPTGMSDEHLIAPIHIKQQGEKMET